MSAVLVVEVASESLRKDRLIKSRVYARAGIREYWIANVDEQRIEVHLDPDVDAERYLTQRIAGRGETLAPRAVPALQVSLDDLFG